MHANLKLPVEAFYRESRPGVNVAKRNITTGLLIEMLYGVCINGFDAWEFQNACRCHGNRKHIQFNTKVNNNLLRLNLKLLSLKIICTHVRQNFWKVHPIPSTFFRVFLWFQWQRWPFLKKVNNNLLRLNPNNPVVILRFATLTPGRLSR
jgi:hypothetical protein